MSPGSLPIADLTPLTTHQHASSHLMAIGSGMHGRCYSQQCETRPAESFGNSAQSVGCLHRAPSQPRPPAPTPHRPMQIEPSPPSVAPGAL